MELYFKFTFTYLLLVCKIEIDFSVLILYPETLINSLLRVFVFVFFGVSYIDNKSSKGKFFFSLFNMYAFILFYCAIVLTKTSSTVLNDSKTGHPC